jgi:hypothetical protein
MSIVESAIMSPTPIKAIAVLRWLTAHPIDTAQRWTMDFGRFSFIIHQRTHDNMSLATLDHPNSLPL